MPDPVIVFDLETVPDLAAVGRALGLGTVSDESERLEPHGRRVSGGLETTGYLAKFREEPR